jgi:hypothetical protein
MAQTELDNLSKRFTELKEQANFLKNLSEENFNKVQNGSLIETTMGTYFMAMGLGKVELEGQTYFIISPASPIGQAMLGKVQGDAFRFRDQEMTILSLS